MEVGLYQGSAFSPFLFVIMMDSLTENIRKSTLAGDVSDDVELCARKKDVMELELTQWREALEKRGMIVSRANTEYMTVYKWNAIRKCSYAICPAATGHRI